MIIRKSYLFMIPSLLGFLLFMTGCESNTQEIDNKILPNNEVVSIMKKFGNAINVDYSNIKEDHFDRDNYAEVDYENYSDRGHYSLTGYSLLVNGIRNIPNTNEIFDGWYVYYVGDEAWGAAIEYSKNNIGCNYYQSLEQEIPYELLAWEGDYDNEEERLQYEEARNEFYEKATYEVELNCGYIPEGAVQYKDFYLDAEGQEPFWYASIRGSMIDVFTPDGIQEKYIDNILLNGENITFKGYNVSGKLEKVECIDGGKGDTHEYKILFDITKSIYGEDGIQQEVESTHYEGCADKIESDFVSGEEGTLSNFIKKTGYEYGRNFDKEKVYYTISDIVDKYVSVNIYEVDGKEYDNYQLILENVDGKWKVIFEGNGYEISYEKCEELNQHDNNLMEMFFLRMCPRG